MRSSRHRLVLRAVGSIVSVARPFKARAFASRASAQKAGPAAVPTSHFGRLRGPGAGVAIITTDNPQGMVGITQDHIRGTGYIYHAMYNARMD